MRSFQTLGSLAAWMLAAAIGAAGPAAGASADVPDTPTFYHDVLPILQQHCQTCHRPVGENIGGMIAPMTLMGYDDARPWARAMARQVQGHTMPPWFASEQSHGLFYGERHLSDAEIATVVRWASTGAVAGDRADAPPPVRFAHEDAKGWTNGRPDLVLAMPQPFFVDDDVRDLNINFSTQLTEQQLPEDTWVRGVEFKVGGTYVHHMCATYTPPGAAAGDAGEFSRYSLGCIALGAEPTLLPEGYGYLLPKGSRVNFSMHYHKEPGAGSGAWDQSQMGLVFNREPVQHRVRYEPVGVIDFEVPPHADRWRVGAATTFTEDTTLLALWPHAHLRAVAARFVAAYPDGTEELLLDVPRYDQEWQTTYRYIEPKRVPAGTRLEVSFWYDNTAERAQERGFDAGQAVHFGLPTTAEMMLGFISYTHSEPIDFGQHPDRVEEAGLVLSRYTTIGGQ